MQIPGQSKAGDVSLSKDLLLEETRALTALSAASAWVLGPDYVPSRPSLEPILGLRQGLPQAWIIWVGLDPPPEEIQRLLAIPPKQRRISPKTPR